MTQEEDLKCLCDQTVERGVDRITEIVETGGDYLPILKQLSEDLAETFATVAAILSLCIDKEIFTDKEFSRIKAQMTSALDQFGASARDGMMKVVAERFGTEI